MRDLSGFVRNCEKNITEVINGSAYVPSEQRDRWRVFTLAKLFSLVSSGSEIEEMLLVAPGFYEGLIGAYHSLLTQRANALWWQRLGCAESPAWPSVMRSAFEEVAHYLSVDPRKLADELDNPDYPRVRQLIALIAQRNISDDGSPSAQRSTLRLPRNGYADLRDLTRPDDG